MRSLYSRRRYRPRIDILRPDWVAASVVIAWPLGMCLTASTDCSVPLTSRARRSKPVTVDSPTSTASSSRLIRTVFGFRKSFAGSNDSPVTRPPTRAGRTVMSVPLSSALNRTVVNFSILSSPAATAATIRESLRSHATVTVALKNSLSPCST